MQKPLLLSIKVTTRAKQPCIYAQGEQIICKVSSPPVDGKANQKMLEMLADALKIPRTQLILQHGLASRNKVVAVFAPLSLDEILLRLQKPV